MNENENRSASNLLPLCLEHAFAIDQDTVVEQYPVELLRGWKGRQLKEYQQMQRSWNQLTEAEIRAVSQASFDAFTSGNVQAALNVARIGQRVVDVTRASRAGPQRVADQYQQRLTAAQDRFVQVDDDGLRIPPQVRLPKDETDQLKSELSFELSAAAGEVEPLVGDLRAEVAVVTASGGASVVPRCQWLLDAADTLLNEVSHWRGVDNGAFDAAVALFEEALAAVTAQARGEAAQEPPQPPKEPGETETEAQQRQADDLLADIDRVLDAAAPWGRVNHRPYDADTHGALITIAPVVDQLSETVERSLQYLSVLAAQVTRNATDEELLAVLACVADVETLHIRLILETDLADVHESSDAVADQLKSTHASINRAVHQEIRDAEFWRRRPHWLLGVVAYDDLPAATAAVSTALEAGRLCEILGSLGHVDTGGPKPQLIIHPQIFRSIPYVNVDDLRASIADKFPAIEPVRPPFSRSIKDDCERLASEFLYAVGDRPAE